MSVHHPVTCGGILLSVAATALLIGCEDRAQIPPAAQVVVKITPEQEMAALVKKADAGDADAQFKLGLMYAKGEDVPKDDVKAVGLFQKSATQGNAKGQFGLANFYEGGRGVAKDLSNAVEWYQKSADQNNPDALFNLGMMHAAGSGVPKDIVKAEELWQKAADNGSELAIEILSSGYAQGNAIMPKDIAKALAFNRKHAERGSATAQLKLGLIYAFGEGVPKDDQTALEWYRKAAAQGDASAQYRLGLVYGGGYAVPKDASIAFEWFKKSAVQGYRASQRFLAMHYAEGGGIPKDPVLAYAWMNLAATGYAGDPAAVEARQGMESALSKDELAEAQRLSSAWEMGKLLVREGNPTGDVKPSITGGLVKASTGTLFMVSKSGHAITNYHVAGSCTELHIQGREGIAKLVTDDKVNDLALVQVQGAVTDFASIASDPGKLRQGEDVVVFGYPLSAVLSSGGNLTPGIVSALTGLGNNTNQIQITAPIQPGSSGSPVLNKKGDVIGVVSMKLSDVKMAKATGQVGQNINFAVSGQTLKTFLDTHKVPYSTSSLFSFEKNSADLGDEARKWTMVVECWK